METRIMAVLFFTGVIVWGLVQTLRGSSWQAFNICLIAVGFYGVIINLFF